MKDVEVPRMGSPAEAARCSRSCVWREMLASRMRFACASSYWSLCRRLGRVEALRVDVIGRKGWGAGRRQTEDVLVAGTSNDGR